LESTQTGRTFSPIQFSSKVLLFAIFADMFTVAKRPLKGNIDTFGGFRLRKTHREPLTRLIPEQRPRFANRALSSAVHSGRIGRRIMGSGFFAKASALLSFAALSASLTTPALAATGNGNTFADVPPSNWAYQAIDQLHNDGLIEGYPDGYFKGHRPLTRYEIAVLTQRVVDKLEADLADASKAAKVNSDDIVLVRRLLDTYGADLAEVKKKLAHTEAQTQANTDQLRRAQIHVGYILRPGEFSTRSVVRNAAGVEVPGATALAGPGVSPGGPNVYNDGHSTHGTGYQILRLGLSGQIDSRTSYNVRLSNSYIFDSANSTSGATLNGQPSSTINQSSASTLNLDYANIQYAVNDKMTLTGGRYIAKNSSIGLLYDDYFNGAMIDYAHKHWTGQLGYSFNTAAQSNANGNAGNFGNTVNFKPGQSIFAHAAYKINKMSKIGASYVLDMNSNYGATAFESPAATPASVVLKPQSNGSIDGQLRISQKIELQGELARHFGKDPNTGNQYNQPYAFWGKAFYGNTSAAINHNYGELGYIVSGVNGLSAHSETYGQGDDYQQFYLNNLDGYHTFYAGVHHYFSDNARVGLVYQRAAMNPGVTLPIVNTNGAFAGSVSSSQGQALFLETVLQF
jgi:hypothetical protein